MKRLELHAAEKTALQQHILGAYNSLRMGMGYVAVAFPVALWLAGRVHGIPLQNSMSAYYWAAEGDATPVRIWFTGGLFALGGFFYLYKGFTVKEDWALNAAAICAIGVAYFPMTWGCEGRCSGFTPHGIFALSLFACLVYVTALRSRDTLSLLEDEALAARYERWYRGTSVVMFCSPVIAMILRALFAREDAYIYFLELAGILAFALFWFIKSRELRQSSAELRALRSEIGHGPSMEWKVSGTRTV